MTEEQTTGPVFGIFPTEMHADILRAMVKHGVDPTDADTQLFAYVVSLTQFFRGLHGEGHPRERIEGWIDWIGPNLKYNLFPKEDILRTTSK